MNDMDVKIVFDPPYMTNQLEMVYNDNGELIGWRTLGWKRPDEKTKKED